MGLIIRKAKDSERELVLKTANFSFSDVRKNRDFSKSMPKVYSPELNNTSLSFLLFSNNEAVGTVMNYPIDYKFKDNTLNTFFLGMVGVIPTSRGKGYMNYLMEAALEEAKSSNKDIAILTGQKQRYEYYQFYEAGYYFKYEINLANLKHFTKDEKQTNNFTYKEIISTNDKYLKDIYNLYSKREMTSRLFINFLYQLQSHTTKVYAVMKNNNFYGYLLFKDGELLNEYELVDNSDIITVLVGFFAKLELVTIKIIIMPWEINKQRLLNEYSEGYVIESSVKIKVYNYLKLIKTLFEFTAKQKKLNDGILFVTIRGINYRISVYNNKVDVDITDEVGIKVNEKDFLGKLTIPNYSYEKLDNLLVNWFPLMFGIPIVDRA